MCLPTYPFNFINLDKVVGYFLDREALVSATKSVLETKHKPEGTGLDCRGD